MAKVSQVVRTILFLLELSSVVSRLGIALNAVGT